MAICRWEIFKDQAPGKWISKGCFSSLDRSISTETIKVVRKMFFLVASVTKKTALLFFPLEKHKS